MTNPTVTVQLHRVPVRTNHGVTAAEREIGQTMVFDVDLTIPECSATSSDELDGTVDYGEVTALLVELATAQSYKTLERLTSVIAERFFNEYGADIVRVRATKPEPPLDQVMDGASVELILRRQP